jgi:tetratricopeptide (TPR) repeat protein
VSLEFTTEIPQGIPEDPRVEFREGVELLKGEYPKKAVVKLKRAYESDKHNPYYISFLGLAIARAEKKWVEAWELCERAVELRPKEIHFHLNLAEVYALAGERGSVLDTLDKALLLFGKDERLERARAKADSRRAPLLPFLGRDNFLNRGLGRLRHVILKKLSR